MKKEKDSHPIPQEHWEVHKETAPGTSDAWGAFLPRSGKDRPTTHIKTNETDF